MSNHQPRVITRSDPTKVSIEWSDGHETVYTPGQLRAIDGQAPPEQGEEVEVGFEGVELDQVQHRPVPVGDRLLIAAPVVISW